MTWNQLESGIQEMEEHLRRPTPEALAECEEKAWRLLRLLSHHTVRSTIECPVTGRCYRRLASVTQRARGLAAQYRSGLDAVGQTLYDRAGALDSPGQSARWLLEA